MSRAPYDYKKVLYVCDLDVCDSQQATIARLGRQVEGKVKSTADKKSEKWETVYCYPTIEFWYLLHYEPSSRSFGNAEQVFREFVRKCQWYEKPMPRDKRESQWFMDRVKNAIENEESVSSLDELRYSYQIRPEGPTLTNPMSEIGGAITNLLSLIANR